MFIREVLIRHVRADGSAFEISGLRTSFELSLSSDQQESSLVSIYNLTNATIGQILPGDDIEIAAGHRGEIQASLYSGSVVRVDNTIEQTDRRTDVFVSARTLQLQPISESWPGFQPIAQIARAVVATAGLRLADDANFPNVFIRDTVVSGNCADALNELLAPHNRVAVQLGAQVKIYESGVASALQPRLVSESAGMVGTPSITDTGVQVRVVLNGDIEPQTRIRLESAVVPNANGIFRVVGIKHRGDTGNAPDWYTELDCVTINE